MRNFRKKYFRFYANCAEKLAQNSLRFMRKNSAKVRKQKICAKIAQILRKTFSHFVETLDKHNLLVLGR